MPEPAAKPWEQRLNEANAKVEQEVRRVVRFLDDEVVPEVRRNGSSALRAAAAQLSKLAEQLDDSRKNGGQSA